MIWATGLLAYIVAVLDRTTLGVSGLNAADRFAASPSVLSTFVVLQVVVYAAAQVPAGVLLDRFGSRALIVSGDAVTFISVLRLVPNWFPPKQVPLLTQLTGICGQLGQVLSALPFLALLTGTTWATAYISVAAFGVLAMVLVLVLVKDAPRGRVVAADNLSVRAVLSSVKTVWLRPGTRLGFFTHMGTQFSVTVFCLMWGVPYLTVAQGQSTGVAGALLTISVVVAIAAGIVIGIFTGRYPHRRSWIVLAIIGSNALVWTVVLALPGRAPLWLLIVLITVISMGGPGSMVGFDFARTFNPSATLGTAQGMVNMGGFIASLLVMQAMGVILGAAGGYSFDSFRLAWTVQYAIWVLAVVGILITRKKARALMRDEQERSLLETFDPNATAR
jgi:nitrate/nitrite transporter NarK